MASLNFSWCGLLLIVHMHVGYLVNHLEIAAHVDLFVSWHLSFLSWARIWSSSALLANSTLQLPVGTCAFAYLFIIWSFMDCVHASWILVRSTSVCCSCWQICVLTLDLIVTTLHLFKFGLLANWCTAFASWNLWLRLLVHYLVFCGLYTCIMYTY